MFGVGGKDSNMLGMCKGVKEEMEPSMGGCCGLSVGQNEPSIPFHQCQFLTLGSALVCLDACSPLLSVIKRQNAAFLFPAVPHPALHEALSLGIFLAALPAFSLSIFLSSSSSPAQRPPTGSQMSFSTFLTLTCHLEISHALCGALPARCVGFSLGRAEERSAQWFTGSFDSVSSSLIANFATGGCAARGVCVLCNTLKSANISSLIPYSWSTKCTCTLSLTHTFEGTIFHSLLNG